MSPSLLTLAAWLHARGATLTARRERGQATIEYLGILLLVGALMAAVAGLAPKLGPMIADAITDAFADAFDKVKGATGDKG
jgi:hypothetical protein